MDRVLVSELRRVPYTGKIYCIQVEEHRRFFANGLLVSNCQILDDAHSAKKVESDATRLASIQWHDNEWRSRLNSPLTAQKLYIGQRTHDGDIYGHVLAQEAKRWVNLCLPLEMDLKRICITYPNKGRGVEPGAKEIFRDPRKVEGELLDPKRFDAETAKVEKEIMSERAWNAQYQQQPEGQGGLILKRHWWRQWVWPEWHPNSGQERPLPEFFELIQVYDTAFEEDEESDFSARTTWGVFNYMEADKDKAGNVREGKQRISAMLLDCMEERLSYPDLRAEAIASNEAFAPDVILIEKKASGHSLIQELKRKRLPVKGFGLSGSGGGRSRRQGDLIARAHESSLMLAKGCIWAPPRAFAYKCIDHCAKFPNGDHDDITSTVTMALQYLRRYYDLTLPDDEQEDEINPFAWNQRPRKYA
jgi:phage terminase large subunit-like protein